MKKKLKYNIIEDCMYQIDEGLMEVRIQNVTFSKMLKDGTILIHHTNIITYVDIKKHKLVSLLTNDMESNPNEIIEIYRKTWDIELLFKQIKTELPLKILLWGKCKCDYNTDLGDTYSQSVAYGNEKGADSFLEFLRSCNNDEDYTYVLCSFYSLFNHPEKNWETLSDVSRKEDCQLSIS